MNYRDIDPADIGDLLARDGLVVLDMRDPGHQSAGTLPGAQPANDAVVGGLMRKRRANPPVLVYCYKGVQSRELCAFLAQMGLTDVYNLTGGWEGWTNRPQPDGGMTPLMQAALEGEHGRVDALVATGADVNALNGDGLHALWFACVHGDPALVEKLIGHGSDIDNRNVNGFTCAMYAASTGKLAVLKALVEGGADLSIRSPDGLGALESAATAEVLRYLRPLAREAVPV